MKLQQPENELLSSSDYERQRFSLGDASVILMLLTQQYNNPIATLTQEYISNARDANREVGQKKPIMVTLPTIFRPVLEIRDYGPGITPERMEKVFLKIATSTKRGDNLQTGGFGIGAKSAWAYQDKFNIITYIDGIERSYVAHYTSDPDNKNVKKAFLDQLVNPQTQSAENKTDQQNGTVIQVPVEQHDIQKFRDAILKTVAFWKDDEYPTLVETHDGLEYNQFKTDRIEFERKLGQVEIVKGKLPDYVCRKSYSRSRKIVVDGIVYNMPSDWTNSYCYREKDDNKAIQQLSSCINADFIVRLNTGDVYIPPTREGIAESQENQDAVAEHCRKAFETLLTDIRNQREKITTGPELEKLIKDLNNYEYSIRGQILKERRNFGNFVLDQNKIAYLNNNVEIGPKQKLKAASYYLSTKYKNPRLEYSEKLLVYISSKTLYIYNDLQADPSAKKLKTQVKYNLLKSGKHKAYIIDGSVDRSTIAELIEQYKVANLSELPKPPRGYFSGSSTSKTKSSNVRRKGTIYLHYNTYCRYNDRYSANKVEIQLDEPSTVVYYVPLSQRDSMKKAIDFLRNLSTALNLNVEFGFLPDKWVEKNKEKYQWIKSLAEFANTKGFDASAELYLNRKLSSEYCSIKNRSDFAPREKFKLTSSEINLLSNQKLKDGLKLLKQIDSTSGTSIDLSFSPWILRSLGWQEKLDNEIKDKFEKKVETLKQMIDEIKNNLNSVVPIILKDCENQSEIIEYINFIDKRNKTIKAAKTA